MSVSDNNKNFLPAPKDPLNELLDLWQAHRFYITHRTRALAESWEFAVLFPVYFSDISKLTQSESFAFTLAADLAHEIGPGSMTGQAILSFMLDRAEEMRRSGKGIDLSHLAVMNVYKHAVPGSALEERARLLLPRSDRHIEQVTRLMIHKTRQRQARAPGQITHQPPPRAPRNDGGI